MILVHSTREKEVAIAILREGIKPASKINRTNYGDSFGFRAELVSLTATRLKLPKAIEDDAEHETFAHFGPVCWGSYHFVIRPKYVNENVEYLRNNNKDGYDEDFLRFVKRKSIKRVDDKEKEKVFRGSGNEIVCLRPIPLEGIDSLVLPYKMETRPFTESAPNHIKIFYQTTINIPERLVKGLVQIK